MRHNHSKVVVLHNSNTGTNCRVAKIIENQLGCSRLAAEEAPKLEGYETIIVVASNTGDEEISQPMEDYLFALWPDVRNGRLIRKRYFVCEIGNYFGLEDYCGCKRVVVQILERLGWEKISDISLDSVPDLDVDRLNEWLEEVHALLDDGQRNTEHDVPSRTSCEIDQEVL